MRWLRTIRGDALRGWAISTNGAFRISLSTQPLVHYNYFNIFCVNYTMCVHYTARLRRTALSFAHQHAFHRLSPHVQLQQSITHMHQYLECDNIRIVLFDWE